MQSSTCLSQQVELLLVVHELRVDADLRRVDRAKCCYCLVQVDRRVCTCPHTSFFLYSSADGMSSRSSRNSPSERSSSSVRVTTPLDRHVRVTAAKRRRWSATSGESYSRLSSLHSCAACPEESQARLLLSQRVWRGQRRARAPEDVCQQRRDRVCFYRSALRDQTHFGGVHDALLRGRRGRSRAHNSSQRPRTERRHRDVRCRHTCVAARHSSNKKARALLACTNTSFSCTSGSACSVVVLRVSSTATGATSGCWKSHLGVLERLYELRCEQRHSQAPARGTPWKLFCTRHACGITSRAFENSKLDRTSSLLRQSTAVPA
jgi:hypothetical protein